MPDRPVALNYDPGIQRDNTPLDATRALDALWTRWRLGRPRKMGGYQRVTDTLNGIPRRVHLFYSGSNVIAHIGHTNGLQQVVLDLNGNFISQSDRTPTGFLGGPNVGWSIDAVFDTTSSAVVLVAHAQPDATFLASAQQTIPYQGQINTTSRLAQFYNPAASSGTYAAPAVAGGIVCVQPYVFDFDINGFIGWSAPNLPNYLGITGGSTGAGGARVSAQKIVTGLPLRGGGTNIPAALFLSLSEVIIAQFIGSPAYFALNTVSPSSSILSPASLIEYDDLYFWAGIDRFLVYNGTVVEVPNQQNQDWFFNNLNRAFAAKAFAFKVPRYGEIWWCAPLYGNTEPSHAIIFNVRENYWYDTQLPADFRTCGYFAQGFPYSVMGSPGKTANGYKLWIHEIGTDAVDGTGPGSVTPIRAYFETPYLAGPKMNPPDDHGLSLDQLEPDFVQTGDMTVTPTGAYNARSGETAGSAVALPAIPMTAQDQLVPFKFDRRLPRLHFESNTLGGSFVSGRHVLHGTPGESRRTGGSQP